MVWTGWIQLAAMIGGADLGSVKVNVPRVAAASNEGELALRRFSVEGGFKIELFAAEPMLAHPVAFAIDEKNRLYVAESFRVGEQVTDIRRHMNWLNEELASTNTAQFARLIEKYLNPQFMRSETERISLLEDVDEDGKADRATVFADDFSGPTSGIAAGVLARRGEVWFTCIPDLWRLEDKNGDGRADSRHSLHHGFAVRFGFYGHDLHGLRMGPDGKLYFSIGDRGLNVVTKEGRRIAVPESGAVLRCNPDGTELELFATGLRNPQELAFDQYGNLFTGDNNSDGGDQARWVHLVEGSDSGWRIGWQFITTPVSRGPWNAEKMWQPQNPEQPAYILPPLANLANGPSGLTYNPGLGLRSDYANRFFMCDFRGAAASSFIHTFGLEPKGASYRVVDFRPFMKQVVATDVEFGTDGAVYVSDWVEGWGKTGKGRIYRVSSAEDLALPAVVKTKEILAVGMAQRSQRQLVDLLSWPDQRVRQEAQFELAERGRRSIARLGEVARTGTNQLARLHAIWAMGQIQAQALRRPARTETSVPRILVGLLADSDPEVRGQTAKVMGDLRVTGGRLALEGLATNAAFPRVQFFAVMALGKIGGKNSGDAVMQMLRQNGDRDPFLRHAGVMALYWMNDPGVLERASRDDSPAVRMGALLAWRRMGSGEVARFLRDSEPRLVLEAARAIYDLPIAPKMSELASLAVTGSSPEPLLRRVLNANHRMGTSAGAGAVVKIATNPELLEAIRVEAIEATGDWGAPSGRDRVTGLWRPIVVRDGGVAVEELRPHLHGLLAERSVPLRRAVIRVLARTPIPEVAPELIKIAEDESSDSGLRVESLRALAAWKEPGLKQVLEKVSASANERVRNETVLLEAKLNPAGGAERLVRRLETGSATERQAALLALGAMEDPAGAKVLGEWLEKLLAGKSDPAVQLELLEAARQRGTPELVRLIAKYDQSRPQTPIGRNVEVLQGGSAIEGKKIFFERAEASCLRCHKVGGEGGEAGPPLDTTLKGRSREYLLESMISPGREIALGYENVVVTLKNGLVLVGTVRSETASELVINSAEEGGPVSIAKSEIESRQRAGSGMPEGLAEVLSKRELRDLVEYLATLAGP